MESGAVKILPRAVFVKELARILTAGDSVPGWSLVLLIGILGGFTACRLVSYEDLLRMGGKLIKQDEIKIHLRLIRVH